MRIKGPLTADTGSMCPLAEPAHSSAETTETHAVALEIDKTGAKEHRSKYDQLAAVADQWSVTKRSSRRTACSGGRSADELGPTDNQAISDRIVRPSLWI
jgi:hypothetical protein